MYGVRTNVHAFSFHILNHFWGKSDRFATMSYFPDSVIAICLLVPVKTTLLKQMLYNSSGSKIEGKLFQLSPCCILLSITINYKCDECRNVWNRTDWPIGSKHILNRSQWQAASAQIHLLPPRATGRDSFEK